MNSPPKRVTLAITTAVVLVVAILAMVAIALWAPDDSRAELLTAGGLLSAVILASMRELFSLIDVDGGGPGAGSAPVIALALLAGSAPALMGCSATQWDLHAFTAQGFRDGANAGNAILRDARMDHVRRAAREAQAAGADAGQIEQAIDEAAAQWDAEHADEIDAQRALAAASTAYSTGAYRAMLGEATDPDALREMGRHAGDAYRELAAILRRRGWHAMPELPDGALEFLGVVVGNALQGDGDRVGGEGGAR